MERINNTVMMAASARRSRGSSRRRPPTRGDAENVQLPVTAARRDGSAIKMNHASVSGSRRARCVVTARGYATTRPAVVKVQELA